MKEINWIIATLKSTVIYQAPEKLEGVSNFFPFAWEKINCATSNVEQEK